MKKVVSKKPKSIDDKIDELAGMVAKSFSMLHQEISSIKTTMKGVATKADILELHDKFVHRREFDSLSLRVSKLEAKAKR